MTRITLLTTLFLLAVAALPATASAAAPHRTLARPTLDLDWRSSATTEDGGSAPEAEALRRQRLGRIELGIGIGLAVGGILMETIVGIDVAVFNSWTTTWGYWDLYSFPDHAAGAVFIVVGALMIAGGTALAIGGAVRLVRLQKARDPSQQARRHWGWRWGPPAVTGAAPPNPAALSHW
jgi:hypothetical protein